MTKDILIKFLNNNCTDAELSAVLLWFKTDALAEEGKKLGFDDWINYRYDGNWENDEKFTFLFDKIQEKINKQEGKAKSIKNIKISSVKKWLTQAAAILLIPILGLLIYTTSEKKSIEAQFNQVVVDSLEIVAPVGSRTMVQLSDGSTVHLNYGSKLKYPQFFSGNTREVVLEGEGFFDVAHNPENPFIVRTANMSVKALGTAFNVLAYPENNIVETTLVNGKVELEQRNANGAVKKIGTMLPGQHVEFNIQNGHASGSQGSVEKYIAWKEGKLIFEDTPVTEVAGKLSRMFNVDIAVEKEVEDYIYTVTLVDESLFQILDLMTIATPVEYKIFPRTKLPDGTYTKQKILIKKKEEKRTK